MVLRRAGLWSIIQEWIDKRAENTDGSSEASVAGATTTRQRSKAADDKAKESEEIVTINDLTLDSSQHQHIHRDSLWWSTDDRRNRWQCPAGIPRLAKLKKQRKHLEIKVIWVPGHEGIEGNERADEEAKKYQTSASKTVW
ncbi:hypothetical protein B0H13DRAFT_1857373 [Mycena leptocephala]|nr:hypothetical protein B0H13DRAFT_1857373 [Mycena leptocephala]